MNTPIPVDEAVAELASNASDLAEVRAGMIDNLLLGYLAAFRTGDGSLVFKLTDAGKHHVESMLRTDDSA